MEIYGLQKLTLLDYPGQVACTVFFGGCDFRCPFCHNYELLEGGIPPIMEEKALLSFLQKRKGLLDGVCLSGGEPLLQSGLPDLMTAIRALGYRVKLDTNGGQPKLLRKILNANLADYVAMDIKSSPEHYPKAIGRPDYDPAPVKESVQLLLEGDTDYEFRTTVVAQLHTASDFQAIGSWIHGAKRYFLQPFTDRDTVPTAGLHAPPHETMEHYAAIARAFVPNTALRGL